MHRYILPIIFIGSMMYSLPSFDYRDGTPSDRGYYSRSYDGGGGSDYNRGPLNMFAPEDLFCGKGWTFPVIIWGDRPTSVCMLKAPRQNGFTGQWWF